MLNRSNQIYAYAKSGISLRNCAKISSDDILLEDRDLMDQNIIIRKRKNDRICILTTIDNERRQAVKLVNFWIFRFRVSNTGFLVYSKTEFVLLSRAPKVQLVITCLHSGQVISTFSNFLVSNFVDLVNLRRILEKTNLEANQHFYQCSHHRKKLSYLHLFVER